MPVCVCVWMYVCVCVCTIKRQRKRDERERKRDLLCVLSFPFCFSLCLCLPSLPPATHDMPTQSPLLSWPPFPLSLPALPACCRCFLLHARPPRMPVGSSSPAVALGHHAGRNFKPLAWDAFYAPRRTLDARGGQFTVYEKVRPSSQWRAP